MDRSGTQRVEHGRHLPRGPGYEDPVEGGSLGEVELPHAERDHRGGRAFPVELPRVDLAEVQQKLRLDAIRFRGDLPRVVTRSSSFITAIATPDSIMPLV